MPSTASRTQARERSRRRVILAPPLLASAVV
jgi:hypothetical protein